LFYRSLISFFKEHKINIELRWEEEKDQLIRELLESPNFSTTHTERMRDEDDDLPF